MKRFILFLIIFHFLSFQATEKDAVMKSVNTFLNCIESRDANTLRSVFLESGTSRFWNSETGEPGEVVHREYLKKLPKSEPAREEIYNTHVRINDKQASVWCKYTFYLNDTISHCGSEVFSLEKNADRWMIVSIDYTIEKNNCK